MIAVPHSALRALGYTEGQTVMLEYRYAEGRYERLSALATATLPIVGIGVPTGAATTVTGVDTGAEAFRHTWHAFLTRMDAVLP